MTNKQNAARKALIVTTVMTLVGATIVVFALRDWTFALPSFLFYLLLLVNTFFSIRCFSTITPPSIEQSTVDLTLLLLYFVMASTFGNPFFFLLSNVAMFAVATLKYSLLLGKTSHDTQLRYKIIMDGIGTISATFCLLITILLEHTHPQLGLWIWTIGFIFGNAYVFFVRPLYLVPEV